MQLVATDGVAWSVCLCVYVCVCTRLRARVFSTSDVPEFGSKFECCRNPTVLDKSNGFTDSFTSNLDLPFIA